MIYTITFLVLLVATAAAMGLTLLSGLRRQRRGHLARAIATVVGLVLTVWVAWLLSIHERALPEREMGIHRYFSWTVAGLVPIAAVTGAFLWWRPGWRVSHRVIVWLLVLATVGALITGLWALWLSEPIAS